MCTKEGEEENELKENKQIKYLRKTLFVCKDKTSQLFNHYIYYAVYKTTTQPCQSIMI